MANKDFQREKNPQAGQGQQGMGGQRKEEVGEPVQLDEKKQEQQGKPGMNKKEGQQQGGGQQGAGHQGAGQQGGQTNR